MFHLQTGVHLQEEELAVLVGEKFHRARTGIADGACRQSRSTEQALPHIWNPLHEGRGCLLNDLLMTALDRALSFADRPHSAVLVGHHLNLDVAAPWQVALTKHSRIAEGGPGFALGARHLFGKVGHVAHDPHTAPASACRRLDQDRHLVLRDVCWIEFVQYRHPGGCHHLLGRDLRTHRLDGSGRRTDPGQACVSDCSGEIGVFREESVARVHSIGAGCACRPDEFLAVEIAVDADAGVGFGDMGGVGVVVGVDRDGADAEASAGCEDPAGNLPAVGNQDSGDGHRLGLATSGRRRSSTSP